MAIDTELQQIKKERYFKKEEEEGDTGEED